MKKLRLTTEEWENMLRDISTKFHEDCKMNVTSFEYTKQDVTKFLNETVAENVIKPTVMITAEAYTTMYELVRQSSIEIQWHMLVKRDLETNTYLVHDVILFPQTNSGTSTTTDQDEFAKWQTELIKDPEFPIEELRGHGHSHVNMNVFSSAVDDAYQQDIITKVEDGDFYLFLILNKKMEMCKLLYDFNQQILFEKDDIEIQIVHEEKDIRTWCKEQIEKYCKTNKTKVIPYKPESNLKADKMKEENYIANMAKEFERRTFGRKR